MHIKFYLFKREKGDWELHTNFLIKNYGEFYKVLRRIDNFTKRSREPRKEI